MRKIFILIILGFLVACRPVPQTPTVFITDTPISIPLPSPIVQSLPENNPTPIQISTATPTTALGTQFDKICVEIKNDFPPTVDLEGVLVLFHFSDDPEYLLDFRTKEEFVLPEPLGSHSASPNGKWWFYTENSDQYRLVFQSVISHEILKIAFSQGWFLTETWLDNTHIAFNDMSNDEQPSGVVIVDVETGQWETIASEYPGIYHYAGTARNPLNFKSSSVIYDPSLRYVAYPWFWDDRYYIRLWDRQAKREVNRLEDEQQFNHNPVWMADGRTLIVAVNRNGTDELFTIDITGKEKQLTNFGSSAPGSRIDAVSLSPDGKSLAFWKESVPWESGVEIAILDLLTLQARDYCINIGQIWGERMIWSPDSHFLAFGGKMEINHYRTIILDIRNHWAVDIDRSRPSGWLAAMPQISE